MRNPARGRKKRPTPPPAARRDADWSWRTPGADVVALALVVAAVALYPAWKSARSDGRQEQLQASEAARLPALKVARVSAYIKDGIAGSSRNGNGGSDKENDLWGPHLDVTFENRASGPCLITRARLEFRQVRSLRQFRP
ncbi:hypothetical protein EV384_4130 [Micromonospora kangleipakensis]|uniref:Uncharacterized protein n=1 Tax=Micromonospora kangleipakensis TaxID=1077942 RepID=A0A4Q8BEL4_9ACTN|nr:hypothetical protein [Micromonospora kangleipakensis]RZU75579.1 hypothetical protein EV384_4130 [Micromonospora kangleipakensis]